jgi:hypothetical protein
MSLLNNQALIPAVISVIITYCLMKRDTNAEDDENFIRLKQDFRSLWTELVEIHGEAELNKAIQHVTDESVRLKSFQLVDLIYMVWALNFKKKSAYKKQWAHNITHVFSKPLIRSAYLKHRSYYEEAGFAKMIEQLAGKITDPVIGDGSRSACPAARYGQSTDELRCPEEELTSKAINETNNSSDYSFKDRQNTPQLIVNSWVTGHMDGFRKGYRAAEATSGKDGRFVPASEIVEGDEDGIELANQVLAQEGQPSWNARVGLELARTVLSLKKKAALGCKKSEDLQLLLETAKTHLWCVDCKSFVLMCSHGCGIDWKKLCLEAEAQLKKSDAAKS